MSSDFWTGIFVAFIVTLLFGLAGMSWASNEHITAGARAVCDSHKMSLLSFDYEDNTDGYNYIHCIEKEVEPPEGQFLKVGEKSTKS